MAGATAAKAAGFINWIANMAAIPLAFLSAIGYVICIAVAQHYQMVAIDYLLLIADWNLFLIWWWCRKPS